MPFRSRREQRLWIAAGLYVLAIYATLGVARVATNFLRDRGLLRPTITGTFLVVLLGLGVWWLRRRPGWREGLVLALAATAYAAVFPFFVAPEERLHLVEYGLVGGLLYGALVERARHSPPPLPPALRFPPLTAFLLVAALGWIDEGIQGLLPSRVYDHRDVAFNAVAGGLAIAVLAGLDGARRAVAKR